jgi:hypothetical protein
LAAVDEVNDFVAAHALADKLSGKLLSGGHDSRVGVEALASCPHILHPSSLLSTLVGCNA